MKNSVKTYLRTEQGFSAVWTAMVLLFLVGATALAVDASEFWQQATAQQRAADLGCLAGVVDAPTNRPAALTTAAEFAREGHPGLASLDTAIFTDTSNVRSFPAGDMILEVETPIGTDVTQMAVRVLQLNRDTRFGAAIGFDNVSIVEEARCEVGSPLNLGDLPLALDLEAGKECENNPTGSSCVVKFPGGNTCVVENGPGSCGSVDLPRHDDPSNSTGSIVDEYRFNLALGGNWTLAGFVEDPFGDPGAALPGHGPICRTGVGNTNEPCGFLKKVQGNKPPQLTDGMITGWKGFDGRLDRDPPHAGNTYPGPITWDDHFLGYAADCNGPTGGADCAPGGEPDTVVKAQVIPVTDCRDPRWSSVPIVREFTPGPNVEYLWSKFAWIQEPDMSPSDVVGQMNDPVHPGESEFASANKVQFVAVRMVEFPLGPDTPVDNLNQCGFFEFTAGGPATARLIP